MNPWLATAAALLLCLAPCGFFIVRSDDPLDRLIGIELGGVLVALVLLLLSEGFERSSFADLSLTVALLSFPSGLVFTRLLERWL
jgi:multisubunit Na+/H+ antiporter MnhF subunit